MANCSSVFGQITLNGNWTPTMIDNLNILVKDWESWYYNISAEPFSVGNLSQPFTATGRWAFENNLTSLSEWTVCDNKPEILRAYRDLITEMSQHETAAIQFNYTEDEPGMCFLIQATAEIQIKPFSLSTMFAIHSGEPSIRLGTLDIALPIGTTEPDSLLELTPDCTKYKLNLPSYAVRLCDFQRSDANNIHLENNNTVYCGFAEIVLAKSVSDKSELIGEKVAGYKREFIGEIEAIYFPTHMFSYDEIECTSHEYTVENLVELEVYDDVDSLIENYDELDPEYLDADDFTSAAKYWGKHFGAFLRSAIPDKSVIPALIECGYFADQETAEELLRETDETYESEE